MDPRLVTPAECYAVSGAWLDTKGEFVTLLQSKDSTRGLLGQLTVAHQGLVRFVASLSSTNQKLIETRQEADELDEYHDGLFKGIYYAFLSIAEFEPANKEGIYALRDHVFPEGLAGTTKTYSAQAGEVGLLEARLEVTHRELLSSLSINKVSLLDKVEELITVGKKLGLVEASKKALAQELELDPEPSASEINEGKARWFGVVNLFSGVIRYAGFSDQEKIKLLAPFESLEKLYQERAKERSRKKAETKPENKAPEPA